MKKKVLSVVLASALFAGAAVSASAVVWGDWDSSSKSGDDTDITALAFTESSYTIRNGAGAKNMLEVVTAYAGDEKIVQEPDLEWEISDNNLVFELNTEDNGATVAAYENSGSATVTVTANDGKVKASCKVVAAPLVKATGFKFENSTYTLPAGVYYNAKAAIPDLEVNTNTVKQNVKLVAVPNDAKFSDAQEAAFDKMKIALVATKDVKIGTTEKAIKANQVVGYATHLGGDDMGVFSFSEETMKKVYAGITNARLVVVKDSIPVTAIDCTTLLEADDDNLFKSDADYTKVDFPAYDPDKTSKTIARDVRASTELVRIAERAGRTGAITIEVGQTAKLGDFVKYGPTNCNVGKETSKWSIDYYNSAATEDDFAVLNADQNKVLGVAVGRVKAVATFTSKANKTMEIEIPINVVARGAKADAPADTTPTTESATLAIGGTYWVESGNANTTWTVDNDNVTILPEVGAGCKVFAKKAGTATVTGTVDGKVVKTVTITIEAAGATTPDVPAEANPSTGDSLLAFLF